MRRIPRQPFIQSRTTPRLRQSEQRTSLLGEWRASATQLLASQSHSFSRSPSRGSNETKNTSGLRPSMRQTFSLTTSAPKGHKLKKLRFGSMYPPFEVKVPPRWRSGLQRVNVRTSVDDSVATLRRGHSIWDRRIPYIRKRLNSLASSKHFKVESRRPTLRSSGLPSAAAELKR